MVPSVYKCLSFCLPAARGAAQRLTGGGRHDERPVDDLAEGARQLLHRDLLPLGLRHQRPLEAAAPDLALAQPRPGSAN